jgi:hypothetical protein
MRNLSAKTATGCCLVLLTLAGCITPQQAVQLRFVDAETNLPLRQVEIMQHSASRSSVLPDVPVYGFTGRKAGSAKITHHVADEQWKAILPGDSQLLLSKDGYQAVRIQPKLYGLRIEHTGTNDVCDELLLEPTTVIKFSKNPNSSAATSSGADSE